jgi:hypothetical protein
LRIKIEMMEEENVDLKVMYCKKCKKRRQHLKCGFGEPGSGNGRWRCLTCREEGI